MDKNKRILLKTSMALTVLLSCSIPLQANSSRHRLIDILGREVDLPKDLQRIYLADGSLLYIYASLCSGDLAERLVALPTNFRSADLNSFNQYSRAFPSLAMLPFFSAMSSGNFNSEQLIHLNPQLIVMTVGTYSAIKNNGVMEYLARANIAIVVLDMSIDPMKNTALSISIMANVLGEVSKGEQINQFRTRQLARVSSPLNKYQPQRPRVLFERAAGYSDECCLSYGEGNFGQMLTLAGGLNLGAKYISGTYGQINQETLVHTNPDKILVTGANWQAYNPKGDWVNLGPGADLISAKEKLNLLMQRTAYRTLSAVERQQVYAIWHVFYDSPFGFIAILKMATWLHPSLFSDINADEVFAEYYHHFLPLPWEPGYWVSL